jgi:ABC-type lipoprotein release transport system permease subunit
MPSIPSVGIQALLLRVEGRTRWRGWAAIAVVAGGIAGVLLAMFAGAQRTETAYNRFVVASSAFDVAVTNGGTTPGNLNRQFDFEEVARLPEVADAAVANYYFAYGATPSGRQIVPADISPFASVDGKFGTTLNGIRLLEGRTATADDEIAVTPLVARRLGLHVGDVLSLYLGGAHALLGPPPDAKPDRLHVVGIIAMQAGIPPLTGGLPPPALLAPSYARTHPDAAEVFFARLDHGAADIATFNRHLAALAPGQQIVTANGEEFAAVDRSLSIQANAIRIVAVLVGVVVLVVLTQVLAFMSATNASDYETLRTLGMTRSKLRVFELLRSLLVATIATACAIATAVALSPLTPIGVARQVEPHPGVDVDLAYAVLGGLAVFAVAAVLGAVGASLTRRRRAAAREPSRSRVTQLLASSGASVAATTGITMAVEPGRGRAAVPTRSTIAAATLAIALVVGVAAFAASLGNLFDHPRLYGWSWDVQIGDAFAPTLDDEAAGIAADPGAEAVAVGTTARVDIAGQPVDFLAIESRKGAIVPTLVAGRAANAAEEIVLGTKTLRDLHRGIGDDLAVSLGETTVRYRIVGRAVFPDFAGAARLGEGAAATLDGMRRLQPDVPTDVILVRRTRDAAGAALLADIKARRGLNVYLPEAPADLAELDRIGGLPSVLAAALAATALATLAAALISSVLRRRRDLAVLKALGFSRRRLSASIAWQSNAIALIATVLGVPLGIVGGDLSWRWFARQLGVPPRPTISAAVLVAVLAGAVVLANLMALIPARLAARTPTAVILRAT